MEAFELAAAGGAASGWEGEGESVLVAETGGARVFEAAVVAVLV